MCEHIANVKGEKGEKMKKKNTNYKFCILLLLSFVPQSLPLSGARVSVRDTNMAV